MKIDRHKVKALRLAREESQQTVATNSNLTMMTFGELERKGGELHPNHAIALAKALGCKLWEIEVKR